MRPVLISNEMVSYRQLDPAHTDPIRLKKEREEARRLKKSQWWLNLRNRGVCHYCNKRFPAEQITMDHVIPLARGGRSTQGNIVAACKPCNQSKKLESPVDEAFAQLEREKSLKSDREDQE